MKKFLLFFSVLIIAASAANAQGLTISSTGQTGTSGANWSVSGSNPVTITATGGTANVNTSVILGYLNNGISVIVQNNNLSGTTVIAGGSSLTKSAGGDATLSLRGNLQVAVLSPITSTSSKINVILWSDYNNNNVGGIAISAAAVINTNGGHFWAGGSSSPAGSYTWNGLTVGNGPSVGSSGANNYGMDLFTSQINTNGGDILLWSGTGVSSASDGIGMQNNPHLNAGSGNVTLITRQIFNGDGNNNTLSVTTTGKLVLATDASNPWTSNFNWATTTSGSNVTLTSALGRPLQINNFSSLGGLTVGAYDGFGSSFGYTNLQNVNINSSINIPGPINIHAGGVNLGVGVEVIASTASGHINFQARGGFSTVANTVGQARGKLMTTGGGDITVNADADNNNSGELNIDWLTIDGKNGDILLEGSTFSWNTSAQVTLPEFYSNLGTLTIRSVTSSNHSINTQWFAMFGTFAAVTLGREGGTEPVLLNSCTVCDPSALNFGTTAFQIAGPISVFGGNINANMNLRSTISGSDILLKATKNIVIGENVAVRSNNGDITFWSNSDGTANATDGDFIGIYSGVSVNSANGLTNQAAGGGTITMAGGTTTQTLASGTIVPTGYALSTRTTNWVGTLPPGGINFGEKTSAQGGLNTLNIHSGGGDIVVKGQSNSSSAGVQWFSGSTGATQVINSGTGTVTIDGLSTSSTAHGIEFMSYASVVHPTVISSNTTSAAIQIKGETSSTNNRAGYQGTVILTANGIGGGIEVHGKVASASNYGAIEAGSLNAYALSGPITFISDGGLGLKSGGTWGKGTLASSSSNITLKSDRIALYPATIASTGTLTVEPFGTSFASALTFPVTNLTVGNTVSGLTLGKSTNTQNITFGSATTIAGPITVYSGNLAVNENLNTSTGAANGDILLKSSGDITLAASKSITTVGGDVILWANSDNAATNGSIALRNTSSITTGSNTVAGGNVWLGGGSDGATWNGLSVGSGYAVPGTSFTPSNGGTAVIGGIYLEGSTINSFGGHVKLAADASTSFYGILSYAVNSIDSKAGKIELDGNASNSSSTNSTGILFGIHDVSIASTMNLTSSASDVAINISGVGRGTGDALALSGTLNVLSTGTGEISINGNAIGSGRSIVAGNFYSGILNAFANSGKITLNGGTKAVQVAVQQQGGQTSGPSKINIGKGGSIANSSSDVFITADNIAIAASGIAVNTTGKVTVESSSNSFASALTFPITNLSLANTVSGLTLGKSTNTQNITFGGATTIAGPITAFGGTIAVNENLNTSAGNANGDILLKSSGNISMASSKSITTNGGAVVLWADADGSGAGDIFFASGTSASILTNGGHLWLGGGAGSTTWNGLTVGDGYAVGDEARSINGGTFYNGITIDATNINTGGGHIQMRGKGKAGNLTVGQAIYSGGMYLLRTGTMNSGGGNIDIEAIAQTGSGQHFGFYNFGPYTFNAGTGNLTITGDASASSSGNFNLSGSGIFMWTNASPIVSAGNITLTGKKSTTSGTFGVDIRTPITTTGGNITIEGDALNLVSNLTSNTNVILDASATLTQAGIITADGLALEGAANASIANTANSFNKFAAGTPTLPTGAIKLVNSKTITIGSVNPTGIYSSGLIEIETTSGDLLITEPIVSTLATGDAVKLYADKDAAAGTAGDGNIIISGNGDVTVETGARALMYSGSESSSTGLTTAAGGSSNIRNNVAATTSLSSISPTLTNTGKFALYRAASANADLSSLIISAGTLSPNFASATTAYTAAVANTVTSITVSPTVADATATIQVKVNSGSFATVTSGNASSGLSLNDGDNVITVRVTAENGTTVKDYIITVTKAATLPVMLVSFEAKSKTDGSVALSWLTASELNNSYFEILRSTDGVNFTSLGNLNGFGNSSQENRYGFIDGYPSLGTNYYMLVQYDTDGTRKELGLRSVKVALKAKEIRIYPNPTKGLININLAGSSSYEKLELIDLTGKTLLSKSISKEESIISFDMSNLASGIYQIRLSGEGKLLSKQIIKQ